jgi:arabinofuranosyltransferase
MSDSAQAELASNLTEPASARQCAFSLSASRVLVLTAAALLALLLLRTAWTGDDAYISFRVLDNFLHGYGPVWNVGERVQTYTDPLFLSIVTFITWLSGNVYLSAIAASLALTLFAFFLIMNGASEIGIVTATAALIFSKAFVDFSISGLENPATHLAIAAYLFVYWRKRDPFALSLIAALAATNRMDTVLFFLPSLAAIYFQAGWRVWKPALIGWTPFFAWSLFSVFYYGFFFPNTAYAKLHTGIPPGDLMIQGIVYYVNALRLDTATLFVIMLGLIMAYLAREWWLAAGVLLNLIYIVRVGGDFMSARFFSASLFLSAALIARYWRPNPVFAAATLAIIAGLGMWVPAPTLTSAKAEFGAPWPVDAGGIADERQFYYQDCGLLRYRRDVLWPTFPASKLGDTLRQEKRKVAVYGTVGMYGYFAGPDVHIIDFMALGDAFLARLPMTQGHWRVGHYGRTLPKGYEATIATGVNLIEDPNLHQYYDHLHTVISGKLWRWKRLKEIFLFNIGHYESLLPRK